MTERDKRKAARRAAFLIIFGLVATATYGSMSISPTRVELSADHDKDVIQITNRESEPKSYQVEVVAWTQTDERREVYSPTEDILAVPPLFTLNPDEEQLVRVGMLIDADPNTERSYRMFITELESPDDAESDGAGISMRIRIGVPVFVAPDAMPSANLSYVESTQIGDQVFVRFRNSGNSHVKVSEVHYTPPDSDDTAITPAAVYVLAGKTVLLPVPLPKGDQIGTVTVVTENLGAMEYELPFSP